MAMFIMGGSFFADLPRCFVKEIIAMTDDPYIESCILCHDKYVEVVKPFFMHGIRIPVGFMCNGVSWPFVSRFLRPWLYEAIYHDYIYTTHLRSRLDADADFCDGLTERGVCYAASLTAFIFVRIFGWLYW